MGFLQPWVIEEQEDQPQINNNSSESEDDDLHRPNHIHQPLRIVYPLQEVNIPLRTKLGRKRAKRQENNEDNTSSRAGAGGKHTYNAKKFYKKINCITREDFHLITLGSEEFPDIPEDLIQSRGSQFAQLMKNDSAMQIWTIFMEASEEKQNQMLEDCFYHNLKPMILEENTHISPEDALLNMSFDQRKFFTKSNLPLGLLGYLENEVIKFFLETPDKVYTADKFSSYERRILHGIALYYGLQSKSYDCKETNSRLLSLYNTNSKFLMPSTPLSEYLADKRQKRIQSLSII